MWYGEYTHTLDEKDRFILPAKFRHGLKAKDSKLFYLTQGLDGCLFMFALQDWKQLEEKFKALPFTKQQTRFFNRLFFSRASEVSPDSQGRILIPAYLKEQAVIKKDIVIIGVSDRIEIWDIESWNNFNNENRKNFETMAENIFD